MKFRKLVASAAIAVTSLVVVAPTTPTVEANSSSCVGGAHTSQAASHAIWLSCVMPFTHVRTRMRCVSGLGQPIPAGLSAWVNGPWVRRGSGWSRAICPQYYFRHSDVFETLG